MEENIQCYAMISGERIVGKFVKADELSITLSNPRIVYEQIDPQGQIMIALIPMNGAEMVHLNKDKVNYQLDSKNLENRYIGETTTIKTPPKAAQPMLLLDQNQRRK